MCAVNIDHIAGMPGGDTDTIVGMRIKPGMYLCGVTRSF
jgi:hypothetical protein